jgi:endonuclease/exonuclease/phosphatase family metal-dependent hydrolase
MEAMSNRRFSIITHNAQECQGNSDLVRPLLRVLHDDDLALVQETPSSFRFEAMRQGWHVTDWMLEPSQIFEGERMGLAILSKVEFLSVKQQKLPKPPWRERALSLNRTVHDKGMLTVAIEVRGIVLRIANTHLLPPHVFGYSEVSVEAVDYLKSVASFIAAALDEPHIIAGDYNNQHRMNYLGALGYRSATIGRETRDTGQSHDDVLWREPVASCSVDIIPGVSDHHFVRAVLSI